MTDSEEEYEVDEYHRVGFAAEVACILVIGCVAGLKGLSKMRRGVREREMAHACSYIAHGLQRPVQGLRFSS